MVRAWVTHFARLRCLFYDAKHVHKYITDKGNEMTLRILVIKPITAGANRFNLFSQVAFISFKRIWYDSYMVTVTRE